MSNILRTVLNIAASVLILFTAATSHAGDIVVFDNLSNSRSFTSTSSVPNTFMGNGYKLSAGTTNISGFELNPVNLSGTSFTSLQTTIFVWGTVNTTGTVDAATPAFNNLLGTYVLTQSGAYTSGYYFPTTISLSTPLSITSPTIGLSFNYQGSTDGVHYSSVDKLTSLISYGTAPTAGSQLFTDISATPVQRQMAILHQTLDC